MLRLFTLAALILGICGCASTGPRASSASGDDFVPDFERSSRGYAPAYPLHFAEVIYRHADSMGGNELADIQDNFVSRIVYPDRMDRKYNDFIGAIVINSVPTDYVQTNFTIWLMDGRRLDSGRLMDFAPHTGYSDKGHPMYLRAMEMLRKAIPESKIKAAEQTPYY